MPSADRGALPGVRRGAMVRDGAGARVFAEHLRSAVGRAVIDDNDLARAALRQRRLTHTLQNLWEGAKFVVYGDENRNFHGFRNTAKSDWPMGGCARLSTRDRIGTSHRSKTSICPSDWAWRRNT